MPFVQRARQENSGNRQCGVRQQRRAQKSPAERSPQEQSENAEAQGMSGLAQDVMNKVEEGPIDMSKESPEDFPQQPGGILRLSMEGFQSDDAKPKRNRRPSDKNGYRAVHIQPPN